MLKGVIIIGIFLTLLYAACAPLEKSKTDCVRVPLMSEECEHLTAEQLTLHPYCAKVTRELLLCGQVKELD